jgi:SAM-dependent methyltransferase
LTDGAPGSAVDVGCGTGRVALALAEAGWRVIGVEPDARMAAVASRRGVRVEVARFEDWAPSVAAVDLVCAGQAWHWVDPAVGCAKAAELLRPGGRLAVFWNVSRYDAAVAEAIAEVYGRLAPELLHDSVSLGTAVSGPERGELAAFDATGRFRDVERRTFVTTGLRFR